MAQMRVGLWENELQKNKEMEGVAQEELNC